MSGSSGAGCLSLDLEPDGACIFLSTSLQIRAAPPVQTAGRGRVRLRRGAHSTCKLIFELCAVFLDI